MSFVRNVLVGGFAACVLTGCVQQGQPPSTSQTPVSAGDPGADAQDLNHLDAAPPFWRHLQFIASEPSAGDSFEEAFVRADVVVHGTPSTYGVVQGAQEEDAADASRSFYLTSLRFEDFTILKGEALHDVVEVEVFVVPSLTESEATALVESAGAPPADPVLAFLERVPGSPDRLRLVSRSGLWIEHEGTVLNPMVDVPPAGMVDEAARAPSLSQIVAGLPRS